ncbi:MAG: hypothetical protein NC453_11390 [Muribaculum sp.]|nr:hypothetical protein [Muribaculum sp.]
MKNILRICAVMTICFIAALTSEAADLKNWRQNGTSFNLEFTVYPIDVDSGYVLASPRREEKIISLSNESGRLNLNLRHIVGKEEVLVNRDGFEIIEERGGTLKSSTDWILSLTYKSKRSSDGITYTLFSGTATRNGKVEPCTLEIAVNSNDPNREVFNFDDDAKATEYPDSYIIRIGNRKWGSEDICGLFSSEIPRVKKIQNALLQYLNGNNRKRTTGNSKSTKKPPLKK